MNQETIARKRHKYLNKALELSMEMTKDPSLLKVNGAKIRRIREAVLDLQAICQHPSTKSADGKQMTCVDCWKFINKEGN